MLDIGSTTQSLAGVQLVAGTITGAGTLTSATAFDAESGTVSAILAGSAGLTKSTSGTVALNAASTYSGQTLVSAGTLNLAVNAALGTATSVVVNGSSAALSLGAITDSVAGVQLVNGAILGNVGVLISARPTSTCKTAPSPRS